MDESQIARIEVGSEAWRALLALGDDERAYKVAIYVGPDGFKIKVNEHTWSPPLSITSDWN